MAGLQGAIACDSALMLCAGAMLVSALREAGGVSPQSEFPGLGWLVRWAERLLQIEHDDGAGGQDDFEGAGFESGRGEGGRADGGGGFERVV